MIRKTFQVTVDVPKGELASWFEVLGPLSLLRDIGLASVAVCGPTELPAVARQSAPGL